MKPTLPFRPATVAELERETRLEMEITQREALQASVNEWEDWHAEHGDKKVLSLPELLSRPTPPELVDDLIVEGSVVTLVSAPGVGKSFIALDLMMSIATGRSTFLGKPLRVDGPSSVYYVLGEGAGRFNLRVKAWQQFYGLSDDSFEFHTQATPVNLLNSDEVNQLKEQIHRYRPKMIVLDTLSRCMPGAVENATEVMSQVVETLYDLKSGLPGCSVLTVHHLNAGGTKERGSTALRAGVDTQILLRPGPGKTKAGASDAEDEDGDDTDSGHSNIVRLTTKEPIGKQKDLEPMPRPLRLTKVKVPLLDANGHPLTDRYGKQLTSLVFVPADQEHRSLIVTYTRQHPTASRRDVYQAVGGNQEAIRQVLNEIGFKAG